MTSKGNSLDVILDEIEIPKKLKQQVSFKLRADI